VSARSPALRAASGMGRLFSTIKGKLKGRQSEQRPETKEAKTSLITKTLIKFKIIKSEETTVIIKDHKINNSKSQPTLSPSNEPPTG
jgi:hypothetical protein